MKFIALLWNVMLLIVLYAIIFICIFLGLQLAMLVLKWGGLGATKLSEWVATKRSNTLDKRFARKGDFVDVEVVA